VANRNANLRAESVHEDLANNKEEQAKSNVTKRPAILKSPDDEEDLHGDVDEELDRVEQVQNDEQPNSIGWRQTRPRLEGSNRNEEADDEADERADPKKPDGERRAVLIQLEAHEPVHQ